MAQVSRPFQIAIAAAAVLGCVWLFALRGHSSSESPSSSASAPSQAASSSSSSSHVTAPGVAGLTKAVEKAHGAVATSERNAAELQKRSEQASNPSSAGGSASGQTSGQHTPAASGASSGTGTVTQASPSSKSTHTGAQTAAASVAAHRLAAIEARLAGGGVALVLVWNPKGSVDISVHQVLQRFSSRRTSVYALPQSQVSTLGPLTKSIQVFQTPTLFVIGPHQLRVLTGLTDAFAVQQTISEVLHPQP
jgi:hypothetical protein